MSIKIFALGYLNNTTDSRGSWTDGGTPETSLVEPNSGCKSSPQDTTLSGISENHSIVTRQKIPIYRNIQYTFSDIWHREYREIERFYELCNGKADRFYAIDFSAGEPVTGFKIAGGNLTASITDTSSFNTTAGKGGYWQCCVKSTNASLRVGKSVSISADANVVFVASYGDLTNFVTGKVTAYPLYNCIFTDDLSNFKVGEHNPETDADGGYMRSGNVSLTQWGSN